MYEYTEFVSMQALEDIDASKKGNDFFGDIRESAKKLVHPDDLSSVLEILDKDMAFSFLNKNESYSTVFRLTENLNISAES
ncbi:MAG: PAS domain-containing protein [Lachnospiraceae bacterium]|nr:PAS domain-containing protein [Lachnospiraceae bacterium]